MLLFSLSLIGVAFFIGAPLFIAIGLGSALICIFDWGMPISIIGSLAFSKMNNWVLLAIPLFMLAGNLVMAGGTAERLLNFIRAWVGHLPGGLLVATVLFCTVFAALTGEPMAAVAAIAPILVPTMLERGYTREVTGGILVSSSMLGNIIPPSTLFIILSALMETPVTTLFIAGVGPGLIVAALLIIVAVVISIRHGFPSEPPASWRTRWSTFGRAVPGMLLAVIILVGIYGGFMTPTEAAAIACLYAIIVGWVVYRGFTWRSFFGAFAQAARMTAVIYMCMAGIGLFAYVISRLGFPQFLIEVIAQSQMSPFAFVLVFMVAFALMGFLLPPINTMIIMIPVLLPIFAAFDINLVWVAVLFVINVDAGGMTPPMAFMIYVTSAITKIPSHAIIRGVIPFCVVFFAVLLLVLFFPEIALWLPRIMGLPV